MSGWPNYSDTAPARQQPARRPRPIRVGRSRPAWAIKLAVALGIVGGAAIIGGVSGSQSWSMLLRAVLGSM